MSISSGKVTEQTRLYIGGEFVVPADGRMIEVVDPTTEEPIGSVPQTIYTYALSPYDDWHQQAWAAALILMSVILAIPLLGRLVLYLRYRKQGGIQSR